MNEITVSGERQLLRNLESLKSKVAKKLSRAALTAGLNVIAKAIKREVPNRWKEGRKSIGVKVRTDKETGLITGKVGVGVGMKTARRAKINAKLKPRNGKKGVGLGINNFHWFVMGTEDRYTGTKKGTRKIKGVKTVTMKATGNARRYTGRMKKTPIVKNGFQIAKHQSKKAMLSSLSIGIEREAAKGR